MPSNLKSLVPLAYVADVERSVAFYTTLGFEVGNLHTPDDTTRPTWAALELHEARIMLAQASDPVVPEQQAVLFYLYYDDIGAEHARLSAAGLAPGAMAYPFYCPKGEFRLVDPDGYCLMLTHT
jgi:catechol 2,3-dioxygenase-like lactoylglutathione lyase family enzyme